MPPAKAIVSADFASTSLTQIELDNSVVFCCVGRDVSINLPAGKVGCSAALGQSGDTIKVPAIKQLLCRGATTQL